MNHLISLIVTRTWRSINTPAVAVGIRGGTVTAMRVTEDEVRRNIKKLSSQFYQDGGVRGIKRIDTARLNCATYATTVCPELTWPSAAENDAAQIIVQSTQRATLPTPPHVIRGN